MPYRCVIVLILAAGLTSCASKPATDPAADTARMPVQAAPEVSYSGGVAGATDSVGVPEMEKGRKINEQDCTKAVDLKAGNLKCK
jgi:hypothetical protein